MILVAGLVALVVLAVATSQSEAAAASVRSAAARPAIRSAATPNARTVPVKPAPAAQLAKSPVPEASDAAWTKFVRVMAAATPATITSTGHLGTFSIGLRRLEDLGLVRNTRTATEGGKTRVVGQWVPPYTLARFLGDPTLQYRVFVASTQDHRKAILTRHKDALGKELHGKRVTLSGLLAVAKQAGLGGLETWLRDESDRLRHPHTTAAFIKTTGLF